MTRTFSKIYGLAGLRIGWAYCPADVAAVLQPHPRAVQRQRTGYRRRVAALADVAHLDSAVGP